MDGFLQHVNSLMGIVSVVALVAVGFFAIAGVINKARQEKEQEAEKVDDRLINLLKEQVAVLEKKVAALEASSKTNQEKLVKLEARNEILEQIFQGRDTQTQEFYKQGFETMKKTDTIANMVAQNSKSIERLAKLMEKTLEKIEDIVAKETTVTVK